MLAVAVVLLVVAVVLLVLLLRTNARVDALTSDLGDAIRQREAAEAARRTAEAEAAQAHSARDDALERANRARRDAAEVAKRMKQEAEARAAAEAATAAAEAELAAARAAASSGGDQRAAEMWTLALAAVRRTWEVSVAPSPGLPSPLEGSDDELRAAIGIEVDAAREEAGAAIDLEWTGTAVAGAALGLRALALVQELVGRLAKATDAAVLRVTVEEGSVTLEVTGTDVEGRPVSVEELLAGAAPEHQVAPGRFELT